MKGIVNTLIQASAKIANIYQSFAPVFRVKLLSSKTPACQRLSFPAACGEQSQTKREI
jgi:hypothetical protein